MYLLVTCYAFQGWLVIRITKDPVYYWRRNKRYSRCSNIFIAVAGNKNQVFFFSFSRSCLNWILLLQQLKLHVIYAHVFIMNLFLLECRRNNYFFFLLSIVPNTCPCGSEIKPHICSNWCAIHFAIIPQNYTSQILFVAFLICNVMMVVGFPL